MYATIVWSVSSWAHLLRLALPAAEERWAGRSALPADPEERFMAPVPRFQWQESRLKQQVQKAA